MADLPWYVVLLLLLLDRLLFGPQNCAFAACVLWVTKRLSSVLEFTAMQLFYPYQAHMALSRKYRSLSPYSLHSSTLFRNDINYGMNIVEFVLSLFFYENFLIGRVLRLLFSCIAATNHRSLITFRDEAMLFAQLCVIGEFRWGKNAGLPWKSEQRNQKIRSKCRIFYRIFK